MWIRSFWVEGYQFLKNSRIKRIELDLDQPFNFILGDNGAGKSKLMEILNVNPIKGSLFSSTGGKGGVVEHNNSVYEFTSVNSGSSAKHTLLKDGEVLCQDAISATYQHHIEYEFGYTKRRHELLTQRLKFTDMRFTERQKVLTDISNIDLTYALETYERLSKRHRELISTVGYLTGRLRDLKNDRLALGEVGETERTVALLSAKLKTAYQQMSQTTASTEDVEAAYINAVNHNKQQFSSLDITKHIKASDVLSFETPATARQHIDDLRNKITAVDEQANGLRERIHEQSKFLQKLEGGVDGVKRLEAERDAIAAFIAENTDAVQFSDLEVQSVQLIGQALEALVRLVQDQPDSYHMVSVEAYQQAEGMVRQNKNMLRQDKSRIETLQHQIGHYDYVSGQSPHCPKCEALVMPADAPDISVYNGWKTDLGELTRRVDKNIPAVEKMEQELKGLYMSMDWTRRYRTLASDNQWVAYLVDHIRRHLADGQTEETIVKGLGYYLGNLKSLVDDIALQAKVVKATERQKQITTALAAHADAEVRIAHTHKLEKDLETLSIKQNHLNAEYRTASTAYKVMDEFHARATQTIADAENAYDALIQGMCNQALAQEVILLQGALAEADNFMGKVRDVEANIALTERDLNLQITKEKVAAKLVYTLSPKTGLIAEQMEGFLSEFVRQINKTITSIWAYPITVKSPEIVKGKMEYRFPVEFLQTTTPDVTETSEGQRGVINLAASLNMMKFQKGSKFPLYMDEVGREFDEEHRLKFRMYTRQLAGIGQQQQVFMISHDSVEYAESSGVNYIVLSSENISLPARANELTKITYY